MNNTEPPHRSLDARVQQARRRSVRYWFEDGVVEIVLGTGFALMGLYFGVLAVLPNGASRALAGSLGLPGLMVAMILGGRFLIARAKERMVYPRTGYVSFARPAPWRRVVTPILGFVVATLLVVLARRAPSLVDWIPGLQGLLLGGLFLVANRSAKLLRLSLLSLVSAITGLLLSIRGDSTEVGLAILYGGIGLLMAGMGTLALRRYLRQAPPPEDV